MVEMVNFIIYILYNKKIKILYLEFKLIKQKNNTYMKKTLKHYLKRKEERLNKWRDTQYFQDDIVVQYFNCFKTP